jgi:hypothetical protein
MPVRWTSGSLRRNLTTSAFESHVRWDIGPSLVDKARQDVILVVVEEPFRRQLSR